MTGRRLVARVTPKPKVAGFCTALWPDFTPPLTRVGIPMADGAIYSPDKALFEVLAPHSGLEPSDYGRTFRSRDELFRIVAINPYRPKYPISVDRVSDGPGFKFPDNDIVIISKTQAYRCL